MSFGYYGHNHTAPCGCPQDVDGPILHGAGGPCASGFDRASQAAYDREYYEAYEREQQDAQAQTIIADALACIERHEPEQLGEVVAVLNHYAPTLLPPEEAA